MEVAAGEIEHFKPKVYWHLEITLDLPQLQFWWAVVIMDCLWSLLEWAQDKPEKHVVAHGCLVRQPAHCNRNMQSLVLHHKDEDLFPKACYGAESPINTSPLTQGQESQEPLCGEDKNSFRPGSAPFQLLLHRGVNVHYSWVGWSPFCFLVEVPVIQ